MKKLLMGLFALGSITSFAGEDCKYLKNESIFAHAVPKIAENVLESKGYFLVDKKEDANVTLRYASDLIDRVYFSFVNQRKIRNGYKGSEYSFSVTSIANENVNINSSTKYIDKRSYRQLRKNSKVSESHYDNEKEYRSALEKAEKSTEEIYKKLKKKEFSMIMKAANSLPNCQDFMN